MSYYIQYIFVRLAAFLLNLMPISFSLGSARVAGDCAFYFMKKRRKVALDNINKAFNDSLSQTEKVAMARAAFQSASVAFIELFIINKIKKKSEDNFTLIGNENLEKAFGKGKGVVLVISHLGSWEYLSFLPYITGQQWSVVVKSIRNPYLNDYINQLRRVTSVVPIEKLNSIRMVLKELKKNHGVAILIDQWSGPEGLWVDLFGVKTSTTSIPYRLVKKTGCVLVPAYCLRKAVGKYEIQIHAPIEISENSAGEEYAITQKLNNLFGEQIKKYPDQWLWGHRRWKDKPSQLREMKN